MTIRTSSRAIAIIAMGAALSCNQQGATSLLPEHAREALNGQQTAQEPVATPPAINESSENSAGSDSWLVRINYYRAMAGLGPVSQDSKMSDGDIKHARYLVKNFVGHKSLGLDAHHEDRQNQWYTAEGYIAGRTSDVIPPSEIALTDKQAIDMWVAGPFHRLPILNPELKQAGFGFYSEDGESAVAMALRKPSTLENPQAPAHPRPSFIRESRADDEEQSNPAPARGVEFPPAGSTVPLAAFNAGEWPNPLAACPGYQAPTGIPITLQLGGPAIHKVESARLTANQQPIESCAFDASNYKGEDETQTETGRAVLGSYGAIVLVPRARLHSGSRYEVSIVADGKLYQWMFQVGGH